MKKIIFFLVICYQLSAIGYRFSINNVFAASCGGHEVPWCGSAMPGSCSHSGCGSCSSPTTSYDSAGNCCHWGCEPTCPSDNVNPCESRCGACGNAKSCPGHPAPAKCYKNEWDSCKNCLEKCVTREKPQCSGGGCGCYSNDCADGSEKGCCTGGPTPTKVPGPTPTSSGTCQNVVYRLFILSPTPGQVNPWEGQGMVIGVDDRNARSCWGAKDNMGRRVDSGVCEDGVVLCEGSADSHAWFRPSCCNNGSCNFFLAYPNGFSAGQHTFQSSYKANEGNGCGCLCNPFTFTVQSKVTPVPVAPSCNGMNLSSSTISLGQSVTLTTSVSNFAVVWVGRCPDSNPTCLMGQSTMGAVEVGRGEGSISSVYTPGRTGVYIFETNAFESTGCHFLCTAGGRYYKENSGNGACVGGGWTDIGNCTSGCRKYLIVNPAQAATPTPVRSTPTPTGFRTPTPTKKPTATVTPTSGVGPSVTPGACVPECPKQPDLFETSCIEGSKADLSWQSNGWGKVCSGIQTNIFWLYVAKAIDDDGDLTDNPPEKLFLKKNVGSSNSFPLTGLEDGQIYHWQLKAENGNLSCFVPSGIASFACSSNRESWFQTKDGDLYVNGDIGSNILACGGDCSSCEALISLNGEGGSPGVVTATGEIDVPMEKYSTEGWNTQAVYRGPKMNFDYLLSVLEVGRGENFSCVSGCNLPSNGLYYRGNTPIELKGGHVTGKVIIFSEGPVKIKGDITVEKNNGFFALVTKNGIIFAKEVKQADGLYLTDSVLETEAGNPLSEKFIARGSFIGWGGIRLGRTLSNEENWCNPAEKFASFAELYLNAPKEFRSSLSFFWEEKP